MKLSAAIVFAVFSAATAAKCGPQVKVCLADSKDESENGAIVCGPGTFHFSPMQCAGDKFEYKKQSTDVTTSSWTGGTNCPGAGQTVNFPYTMACYTVEC